VKVSYFDTLRREGSTPSQAAALDIINQTTAAYIRQFGVMEIRDVVASLTWILAEVADKSVDNPDRIVKDVAKFALEMLQKKAKEKLN
jgi:hypothetical protein